MIINTGVSAHLQIQGVIISYENASFPRTMNLPGKSAAANSVARNQHSVMSIEYETNNLTVYCLFDNREQVFLPSWQTVGSLVPLTMTLSC